MKKIILFLIILILIIPNIVYGSEETISEEDILQAQQESLDINSFINEADKYTENVYEDIDLGELFSSAISRQYWQWINNKKYSKGSAEEKFLTLFLYWEVY